MIISFKLPHNNKPVKVKEFIFKDLRRFILYKGSYNEELEFLNDLLITKGLNSLEKVAAFLILRKMCVGEEISLNTSSKHINVHVDVLLNSIIDIPDISETVQVDNLTLELDYPQIFVGNTKDVLFSVIKTIEIESVKINLHNQEIGDYTNIVERLPPSVLTACTQFIKKNINNFNIQLLGERKHLGTKEISINLLDQTAGRFCTYIFNTMSESSFRDIIFILSKRINDIQFLLNSTPLEVDDYIKLYREEVARENEALKKETIS